MAQTPNMARSLHCLNKGLTQVVQSQEQSTLLRELSDGLKLAWYSGYFNRLASNKREMLELQSVTNDSSSRVAGLK